MKRTILAGEVADILEQWRPANWAQQDLQFLEPLLPIIRKWVTAVPPRDAKQVQRFLGAVAGKAVLPRLPEPILPVKLFS